MPTRPSRSGCSAPIHLHFGLPAVPSAALKRFIKRADRQAAFLEATQLAGFGREEATKIFGRPEGLPRDIQTLLEPWEVSQAQHRYRERVSRSHGPRLPDMATAADSCFATDSDETTHAEPSCLLPRPPARDRSGDPRQPCGDADQHRICRRAPGVDHSGPASFSERQRHHRAAGRSHSCRPKSTFGRCFRSCGPGTGRARWCSIAGRASAAPRRPPISRPARWRPIATRPRSPQRSASPPPPRRRTRNSSRLADDILGRQGRMVAAVHSIGRGADCMEGTPFMLKIDRD